MLIKNCLIHRGSKCWNTFFSLGSVKVFSQQSCNRCREIAQISTNSYYSLIQKNKTKHKESKECWTNLLRKCSRRGLFVLFAINSELGFLNLKLMTIMMDNKLFHFYHLQVWPNNQVHNTIRIIELQLVLLLWHQNCSIFDYHEMVEY